MYIGIHSFYCKINAFSHFYLKIQCIFLGLILISFNYSLFTFGHSRINFISVFPVFFILPISKSPFLSLSRIVGICWFTSIIVYSLLASPGFGLSRNNFISVFPVFWYCKFKYVLTSFLLVFPLFCFISVFPVFYIENSNTSYLLFYECFPWFIFLVFSRFLLI